MLDMTKKEKIDFVISKLSQEFKEECEEIAEQCEEEGYPPHGSNYDLRVDNLMKSPYYEPLFNEEFSDEQMVEIYKEIK